MSLDYIRQYYQVPAEIGRRVEYSGSGEPKQGVIIGAHNQYLEIHFDGEKKPRGVYHAVDGMKYLGMGTVPKLTRSQQRYARYRSLADLFQNFGQFLAYEKDEREACKMGFSSVWTYRDWLRTL